MKNQNHQNPAPQYKQLPGRNSEYKSRYIIFLGKIFTVFTLIILIENIFGHPHLRTYWHGYSKPETMSYCRVRTITGEVKAYNRYRPLIGFSKTENTLTNYLLNKGKSLLSNL